MAIDAISAVLRGTRLCAHVRAALLGNMSEEERGPREQLQEFIESYRSETCLWMTKSKDYHDRNKKKKLKISLLVE